MLPQSTSAAISPSHSAPSHSAPSHSRDDARARIITAAITLLNTAGREAVTTRAVAEAAGLQAPAIYRLFTDMSGLLHAVAEHGFAAYIAEKKSSTPIDDPVDYLRAGWSLHIGFGLANPALYKLMYCDPQPGLPSPAAARSYALLREHIHRVAVAGRLRLSEERAAALFHAAACGIVLTLLATPEPGRDMAIADTARDLILSAITTQTPLVEVRGPAPAAVALRAVLGDSTSITPAERTLMAEWLDRIAAE